MNESILVSAGFIEFGKTHSHHSLGILSSGNFIFLEIKFETFDDFRESIQFIVQEFSDFLEESCNIAISLKTLHSGLRENEGNSDDQKESISVNFQNFEEILEAFLVFEDLYTAFLVQGKLGQNSDTVVDQISFLHELRHSLTDASDNLNISRNLN